jgi:transcriptional regulator with XRE-family HTH domain
VIHSRRNRYTSQEGYIPSDTDTELRKLGKALQREREDAGLEQSEAAEKVGISRVTLSRYENGRQRAPHDVVVRLRALYMGSASVPRGTIREPEPTRYERDLQWLEVEEADAPPRLRARYERLVAFERKKIRDGATDDEANYIRSRGLAFLRSMGPEDFWGDDKNAEDGEQMLDVEFDNYLEHVVGPIVEERIESRAIQPIKPADVPAAVERRRAEIDAEAKKRKAK